MEFDEVGQEFFRVKIKGVLSDMGRESYSRDRVTAIFVLFSLFLFVFW